MTKDRDVLHDNLLTCDESLIYRVPIIMALCISKLKSDKCNGNKGFTSDHLYISGKRLHILLSLLYKYYYSMVIGKSKHIPQKN